MWRTQKHSIRDKNKPLLDKYLPDWRSRQVDRITVTAPPEKAWAEVRGLDFYQFGLVRSLFWLRTLPDRLMGRGSPLPPKMRIDDIWSTPEPGFRLLEEQKGQEIALGAIGQVWKLKIPFLTVAPKDWASFHHPNYCKVAWSLRVEPVQGGSTIRVEVRVGATNDEAWDKFKFYWGLSGPSRTASGKCCWRTLKRNSPPCPNRRRRPCPL